MRRTALIGLFLLIGAAGAPARTLDDMRSAGLVTCGLDAAAPGLSVRAPSLVWTGVFVDFCRALAAAVLGDGKRTNLVALSPEDRLIALQAGEIDVLLAPEPIRSGMDADNGLIAVIPLVHRETRGLESFAPLLRQGDDQWLLAVREVEFQLFRAAGEGLTQAAARAYLEQSPDPETDTASLGLWPNWKYEVVAAAGNYEEIVARNLGVAGNNGPNAISSKGGLHWAPP